VRLREKMSVPNPKYRAMWMMLKETVETVERTKRTTQDSCVEVTTA